MSKQEMHPQPDPSAPLLALSSRLGAPAPLPNPNSHTHKHPPVSGVSASTSGTTSARLGAVRLGTSATGTGEGRGITGMTAAPGAVVSVAGSRGVSLSGSTTGSLSGSAAGSTAGSLSGSATGSATGSLSGPVPGRAPTTAGGTSTAMAGGEAAVEHDTTKMDHWALETHPTCRGRVLQRGHLRERTQGFLHGDGNYVWDLRGRHPRQAGGQDDHDEAVGPHSSS